MFEWDDPEFLREQQQFQIVNGLWFFKRGESWSNQGEGRLLTIELADLKLSPAGHGAK
jgi:hypothetical protein